LCPSCCFLIPGEHRCALSVAASARRKGQQGTERRQTKVMQSARHTSAALELDTEVDGGGKVLGECVLTPLTARLFAAAPGLMEASQAEVSEQHTIGFPPSSALALYLASLHDLPSTEARADASLASVVDSALEFMHERSQHQQPPVRFVAAGLPQADRHESLAWLLRAFEVMNFSDSTLFHAILLLDRYYACQTCEEVSGDVCGSQQRLLAAVCVALKTGPQEDLQLTVRQIITHLSRNSIDFSEIVTAEVAMLRKLQFRIGTPTPHDFCEALNTRCLNCDHRCKSLADYLLQITLVDVHLHYRYSHAVLAGAALALALFAMRAPADAFTSMLEDLAVVFVGSMLPTEELLRCCAEVHELWAESTCKRESAAEVYLWHLSAKFGREDRHGVANLVPPAVPPMALPPQYDLQDAMNVIHQSKPALATSGSEIFARLPSGDVSLAQWTCGSADYSNSVRQHAVAGRFTVKAEACEEDQLTRLAMSLRRPAERSQKLRCILARHGWRIDEFSCVPDLEHLFADVARAARATALDYNGACSKIAWGSVSKAPVEISDMAKTWSPSSGNSCQQTI